MSDIIDQAQHQSELILELQIKQATSRAVNEVSSKYCTDCGEMIPPLRRQKVVGCVRCVACQSDFEKSQQRASTNFGGGRG